MKIFAIIGNPGTTLSCAANSRTTARRGSGMPWDTQSSYEMSSRVNRLRDDLVRSFAGARAKALGLASVPVTVDLPICKQVSVPSSAHERSP